MDNNNAFIQTLKEIFQTALISFGIFLFIYIFLVQPHRVQGVSMEPSFDNGELLLTEKLSYRFTEPQRGDVVVFEAPVERKADFIKRIIAIPGDSIKIENGEIFINGLKKEETIINGPTLGNQLETLGKDEYWVLGDNRTASSHSRSFGKIS